MTSFLADRSIRSHERDQSFDALRQARYARRTRRSKAPRSSASCAAIPYVELVHWIHQILQTPDSDLHRIVRHFELDASRLAKDVTDALDRLPRGATSISDLSSHVENAVERGWVYATLMYRRAARPHRPHHGRAC